VTPKGFQFDFRLPDGNQTCGAVWLYEWASRYPRGKYPSIGDLLARHDSLSSDDFVRLGRWKDGALKGGKWRPNVASVAYPVWQEAASSLSGARISSKDAREFLSTWKNKSYIDNYKGGLLRKKIFGVPRGTTLLHVVTGGQFPIMDSRVGAAAKELTHKPVRNTVGAYFEVYVPLFAHLMAACETSEPRKLDEALFAYGRFAAGAAKKSRRCAL
jgi:hypothetical protein